MILLRRDQKKKKHHVECLDFPGYVCNVLVDVMVHTRIEGPAYIHTHYTVHIIHMIPIPHACHNPSSSTYVSYILFALYKHTRLMRIQPVI